jgi:DNA-binding NarL/FixJ family response regulator
MLGIALLDDHELMLKGTASFLVSEGYEITFTSTTLESFKEEMKSHEPDLAIVDCVLPGIASLRHLKEIPILYPRLPIIAYTQLYSPVIFETLKLMGIKGYCNKNESPNHLLEAINKVMNNMFYYPNHIDRKENEAHLENPLLYGLLSAREHEVLLALAEGLVNKEIACKLFISLNTVEFHRKNIMQKLDAHNSTAMVLNAVKMGLL